MTIEPWLIGGGIVAGAVATWLWVRTRGTGSGDVVQAQVFQQQMMEQLDRVMTQMDRRLVENVRAMHESKSFLADRVSSTERTVRDVSAHLGRLTEATVSLKDTTDEIASFQQLLKSPKVRGSFGEVLLENLMANVLPQDRYQMQYALSGTGEVADAIIKLQDGYIVAIDAKFPLANFERFAREEDPGRRQQLRRELMRDIKRHVQAIGQKYIVPAEQTLDYAFMYIPMEGVYYETMVQDADGDSLWDFCLQHRVVPVSPNSFLAYLQTVLIGLKGMRIEQQAREILERLGQLKRDFGRFGEDFAMVGKHITNAKNRFDDAARVVDRFGARLEQVEGYTEPVLAAGEYTDVTNERA